MSEGEKYRVTMLGGGAWGTALALAMLRAGHAVRLWARDAETVAAIGRGENPRYLPGIVLEHGMEATTDISAALTGADCVLAVTPAQSLRNVLSEAGPHMPAGAPLVLCAKGIERQTGELLSTIVSEILPGNPVAALSGPSFATDVARGLPTAVVVAAREEALAADLAQRFSALNLRCYSSDDLVGVEIGGALKNVFAIAAGAVTGAGLGASAQAAMVTRGFVELRRIGAAFGARPETLMGLSGLGDLLLSCASSQSRNFGYGLTLGRGESLVGRPLAEGVPTAAIAARIAAERGIEAPIISAVAAILEGAVTIHEAVSALMSRPLKNED
jgi:glycerol-3-phosphate dehydrogenase (NAD(P)+)